MAVAVKPAVFRDVTPCSMVENAVVSVDGDGEDADGEQLDPFVTTVLPDYTASHPAYCTSER
jgi:hypothetical protein